MSSQSTRHTYPLTLGQTGVLLECLDRPDAIRYNLPIFVQFPAIIPAHLLARLLEYVIRKHNAFYTRLTMVDGEFRQYRDDAMDTKVRVLYMTEKRLARYKKRFNSPFQLFEAKLWRMEVIRTEKHVHWLICMHHIICDGMSTAIFIKDMQKRLSMKSVLPERITMFDIAQQEVDYMQSDKYKEDIEKLKILYKDYDYSRIQPPSVERWGKAITYSKFVSRKDVEAYLVKNNLHPLGLFYAAYAITLSSYMHSNKVCFASIFHGRDSKEKWHLFGMLCQTKANYIEIDPKMTLKDLHLQFYTEFKAQSKAAPHLTAFCKEMGFVPETLITYQGKTISETLKFGPLKVVAKQPHANDLTNAGINFAIYAGESTYELRCDCSDAVHTEEFIRQFTDSYFSVIKEMMLHPEFCVEDVTIMTESLRKDIMRLSEGEKLKDTASTSLLDAIHRQVEACPEKEAVVSFAADGHKTSLSYRKLWQQSDILSYSLAEKGVKPGDAVILEYGREAEFVVAALAVMKAGGCYVAVDPAYPESRKEYIRKDSCAKLTLKGGSIGSIGSNVELPEVDGNSCAYIIYTSGSTGVPKGVQVSHKALWAFVRSISQVLGITGNDRISCHSSFSFDASVEDLYPVLCAGGTLFIVPEDKRRDIRGLARFLRENNITGGNYTTQFGTLLMEECDLNVRYLVLGGEKMVSYPKRNRHVELYNTYGPTEFTVDATYFRLQPDREYPDIPIGRPLPGVRCYIVNQYGKPVGRGVQGELCLAGEQMASGYLGKEEATLKVFTRNTADENAAAPFDRMYHTGDIVCWEKDGNIRYLRRKDNQVKLRGFRIELSDIESRLEKIDGVVRAIVTVQHIGGADHLCCHVLLNTNETGRKIDIDDLRGSLADELPYYMMPDFFIPIDEVPLTPVGKVDVKSLPMPVVSEDVEIVAPETEDEKLMYETVAEVLGTRDFGVTTDLTFHGITSIQTATICMRLASKGLDINPSAILSGKTIRSVLDQKSKVCRRYSRYVKNRKTVVIVSGVTWAAALENLLRSLQRLYNVVVIDTLKYSDTEASFDDIVSVYLKLLEENLQEGEKPAVIMGHSFGGELALVLARRWGLEHGGSVPDVAMLDTSAHLDLPMTRENMVTLAEKSGMDQNKIRMWSMYFEGASQALRLHSEKHFSDHREGNVILFDAYKRKKEFAELLYQIAGSDLSGLDSILTPEEKKTFLCIAGRMNEEDNATLLHTMIPQLRVVKVYAGHISMLDGSFTQYIAQNI